MTARDGGRSVARDEIEWKDWNDHIRGQFKGVQWASMFTEVEAPGMGLFEIAPGCELPRHHHTPAEVYFVIHGTGSVKIYNKVHELAPGTTVYIPPDARHVTRNTGEETLRILYTFPNASFSEVDYHLDE